MKFVTQDYYEILSVSPGATNEEVKRAYRLVRQSFRPDSMAIHSLYSEEETEAISAKIDEAFRILSDPELARRYAKYNRTARPGTRIPRDPDVFFDLVHDLDGPSPIEQLARHVGRLSDVRREGDRVIEEPVAVTRSLPPEPRFHRTPDADMSPSTGSLREVRPVAPAPQPAIAPEPLVAQVPTPVQPLFVEPPPARPDVVQPDLVAALAPTIAPEPSYPSFESFESLEELPDEAVAEPGEQTWSAIVIAEDAPTPVQSRPVLAPPPAPRPMSAPAPAPIAAPRPVSMPRPIQPPQRRAVEVPVRPAAAVRSEPSAYAETAHSVPPVSPRVDPTSLALPGAQVGGPEQQTTLATVAAVAHQPAMSNRRWARDTIRKRAMGPLDVQPLGRDVLEALEMDCGGMNGAFLKTARRELEVSVKDISERTRISVMMLRSIEADAVDDLPAKVYLKGYLTQIARLLRLPVTPTVEGYFKANGIP